MSTAAPRGCATPERLNSVRDVAPIAVAEKDEGAGLFVGDVPAVQLRAVGRGESGFFHVDPPGVQSSWGKFMGKKISEFSNAIIAKSITK